MPAIARNFVVSALLCLAAASALAQGTIPGLTSTPITFSGHADDFTAGPDGNVWLVDSTANAIGRLAIDGSAYQAFPVPTAAAGLNSIVAGPDGNLWFTESLSLKVGRITTSGTISEFAIPPPFVYFLFGFVNGEGTIAAGPDGNLWISGSGQMARVTPQGVVTVLTVAPPAGGDLWEIGKCVAGPDANLWCLSNVRIAGSGGNGPAKITTAGIATVFPGTSSQDFDILNGPDGNLWISAQGAERSLMRVTPDGVETVYALPTTRESRLAAGNDGNIWFTERTTNGNLWQMVLSTATDDGHATFNSAPIPLGYPEGIVAVTSPPKHASGIHAAQAPAGCPEFAYVLGSSASYGSNLSWEQIVSPPTCTDVEALHFNPRYVIGNPAVRAICFCKPDSPYDASDPRMDVQFPRFVEVTDIFKLNFPQGTCSMSTPVGKGPLVTCTSPTPIRKRVNYQVDIHYVFLGLDPAVIKCSSSTPEINPYDNQTKYYDLEFIGGPPPKPPVNTKTRR